MRRLSRSLILNALLASALPALAFEGAGLPLPNGWVGLPVALSAAALPFLLRNARGRGYLGLTVLGMLLLGVAAVLLVTGGGQIWLIGAAMLVLSPWILLLILMIGVWRTNDDPKPRVTQPFDRN